MKAFKLSVCSRNAVTLSDTPSQFPAHSLQGKSSSNLPSSISAMLHSTGSCTARRFSGDYMKFSLTSTLARLSLYNYKELAETQIYEGQSISNASYFFFSFTFQENSNTIT